MELGEFCKSYRMILELVGLPGVGKFTIGRVLAKSLNARLVDNHNIANPAFVSTSFGSHEFYDMVRSVRALTFESLKKLPASTSIILTTAPSRSSLRWRELQEASRELAVARQQPLLGVHLRCEPNEGVRRLKMPDRALLHKITDPSVLNDGFERLVLLDHCDLTLDLDVTMLAPSQAANVILEWLNQDRSE